MKRNPTILIQLTCLCWRSCHLRHFSAMYSRERWGLLIFHNLANLGWNKLENTLKFERTIKGCTLRTMVWYKRLPVINGCIFFKLLFSRPLAWHTRRMVIRIDTDIVYTAFTTLDCVVNGRYIQILNFLLNKWILLSEGQVSRHQTEIVTSHIMYQID